MLLSLTFCRAQEAHHLALADAATLDNVKRIASAAAVAWGKEATAAGHREERKRRTLAVAQAAAAAQSEPTSPDERGFSENPDRGHASRVAIGVA